MSLICLGSLGAQFTDELVEVVGGLEILVDAGEADVGHGVDPGQPPIVIKLIQYSILVG